MSKPFIKTLKVTNFKSIDSLELHGLDAFSVFAGPNGSGKSNFFDALDFTSTFIRYGVEAALRAHGGFRNIHSEKRKKADSRRFTFAIEAEVLKDESPCKFSYALSIHELDATPSIEEKLIVDGEKWLDRKSNQCWSRDRLVGALYKDGGSALTVPISYSALLLYEGWIFTQLLSNINLYRIDPIGAKEPNQSDKDPSKLERKGHNLASVLSRMEQDDNLRETIVDLMSVIVPGLENIKTEEQKLDGKVAVLFKEDGTRKRFPTHLISDGTIYALCLIVAVLDASSKRGITLVEEPERGLHPKVIGELIKFIREQASAEHPIWLTTHSSPVVHELQMNELILTNKKAGKTSMKRADSGNLKQASLKLPLEEAWISNLLNGGLPW